MKHNCCSRSFIHYPGCVWVICSSDTLDKIKSYDGLLKHQATTVPEKYGESTSTSAHLHQPQYTICQSTWLNLFNHLFWFHKILSDHHTSSQQQVYFSTFTIGIKVSTIVIESLTCDTCFCGSSTDDPLRFLLCHWFP